MDNSIVAKKDKADFKIITFNQSGNSIQRPTKVSFIFAEGKFKKRAISKAARQTILDVG